MTIVVDVNETRNCRCARVEMEVVDLDVVQGPQYRCTIFNPEGRRVDSMLVYLGAEAWQNWGPTNDPEVDKAYQADVILGKMLLERKTV